MSALRPFLPLRFNRVAPSFIRFGNFELPVTHGDVMLLKQLLVFTRRRDFPELISGKSGGQREELRAECFA